MNDNKRVWRNLSVFLICINTILSVHAKGSRDAKVVIVGGGIAGLGAADQLISQYGFTNVQIVEALDRVGGRIHPVAHGDGYLQMGAQFIHHRDNALFDLLVSLDLVEDEAVSEQYNNHSRHTYLTEPGCPQISAVVKQHYLRLIDEAKDAVYRSDLDHAFDELSVGQLFEDVIREGVASIANQHDRQQLWALMKYFERFMEADSACPDWKLLPTQYVRDFDGWDDYKDYLLKANSYRVVLDHFLARIPAHAIRTGAPVTRVDYDRPAGVRVHVGGRHPTTIDADHVIVTTSVGFLKENMDRLFRPLLPERKRRTIQSLGVGTLDKVLMEWDEPWWPADTTAFNMIRQSNCAAASSSTSSGAQTPPLSRLARLFDDVFVHETFPNMLLAWVGGDEDPALMEASSEEDLIDAALAALTRFTGRTDIPRPRRLIKTAWQSDPYFRGSYAWYSRETQRLGLSNADVAAPVLDARQSPRLMFAGEATHSSFYQTTHGAFLSGLREADRLASFYSGDDGVRTNGTVPSVVRYDGGPDPLDSVPSPACLRSSLVVSTF